MYDVTTGPWHEGHAVTCEILGQYVTIVSTPEVAEAIALLLASSGPHGPPQLAWVGRRADPTKPARRSIVAE